MIFWPGPLWRRIARGLLAFAVGGYFVANAVLLVALIDFKRHGEKIGDAGSHFWAPVLADMGAGQSLMWGTGVLFYGVAAAFLALGRRGALFIYAAAVACDFANWRTMMTHPSYVGVFGPNQAKADSGIFLLLIAVGAVIWVVERTGRAGDTAGKDRQPGLS